jgi:hypothetical protein
LGSLPIPTQEKVAELFARNRELVDREVPQGSDRLELTRIATPTLDLIDQIRVPIVRRATEEKIYRTGHSLSDSLVPVRVNTEEQVWTRDTLRQALDVGEIVHASYRQ